MIKRVCIKRYNCDRFDDVLHDEHDVLGYDHFPLLTLVH
jgi:hypothetical protein